MITAIKQQPPFKRLDALLYVLLAGLIYVLFWVFVFARPQTPLTGIEVWVDDRVLGEVCVLRYDMQDGNVQMDNAWAERIRVEVRAEGCDITLFGLSDAEGYNTVSIRGDEARVIDADCSHRKDCTLFHPIRSGGQSIICVPHRLTVVGVGDVEAPTDNHEDIDILLG